MTKPAKKRARKPIHKGRIFGHVSQYMGAVCGGLCRLRRENLEQFTLDWSEVTCARCLRAEGKEPRK